MLQLEENQENVEPNSEQVPTPSVKRSFRHEGFPYVVNKKTVFREKTSSFVTYWRCPHYRQPTSCKATLLEEEHTLEPRTVTFTQFKPHSCNPPKTVQVDGIFDASTSMREKAEIVACQEITLTIQEVAKQVSKEFEEEYKNQPTIFCNIRELERAARTGRTKGFSDWEGKVKTYPLSVCSPTDIRLFFKFMLDVEVGNELQKIIGWAHPELLLLFAAGLVNLFLDCTFKCVPFGFFQLLIIMMYCPMYGVYVPVWYILLQSKAEIVYYYAIQQAICGSKWKMEALSYTCDFEQSLMKACKTQYPEGILIGCFFHFKQAIRRKLIKFNIPMDVVHDLMKPGGLIELLTVIPIEEIERFGIPFIRATFDETGQVTKFNAFWKYFCNTWLKKYSPHSWNIHAIVNTDRMDAALILINRTNNALERFNRKLGDAFSRAHPNMVQFVQGINAISLEFVAHCLKILGEEELFLMHIRTSMYFKFQKNTTYSKL